MYIPETFAETDVARLQALMRDYPFATLLTVSDGEPTVSHLPLLLDKSRGEFGVLRGHLARANPQCEHFGGKPVLVMFHGPHAYISPTWYGDGPAVPTWNYAVVHAHGVAHVLQDDEALDLVHDMVVLYDENADAAWPDDDASDRFRHEMITHVVAFEIPIARLEGKYKMSQNRPDADRPGIAAALNRRSSPLDKAVAKLVGGE